MPSTGPRRGRATWRESRERAAAELGYTTDPYTLIVGGGQGGIALAARLRQLDVPTIVIDRNARPGDAWRNRYKSLCLHDPVWYDHLPCIDFPQQLVLAMGVSGKANVPAFEGMDIFAGDQHHSSKHPGPDAYRGKKAVVIGANNSAHDICAALWEADVDVTMVQRSSTHIVKSDSLMDIALGGLYSEPDLISQEVADKVGKVWGRGSATAKDPGPWEGEERDMWKPTQQQALWFHGGNLHQSRSHSLFLAPQLKARLEHRHPGLRAAAGASPGLGRGRVCQGGPDDLAGRRTGPAEVLTHPLHDHHAAALLGQRAHGLDDGRRGTVVGHRDQPARRQPMHRKQQPAPGVQHAVTDQLAGDQRRPPTHLLVCAVQGL